MYRLPQKDPEEILDYVIDFADEFGVGSNDTVSLCTVVVIENTSPALVVSQTGYNGTEAFFWLEGGIAGSDYDLDVTVDTTLGRRYNGTYSINIVNK